MGHDIFQGLQTRIQLPTDTVPSLSNRDGATGGKPTTFTLSLPWCVVSSACVINLHCREKMPFGKPFNTSNLSCLGSELSPRSIWKRHCSQDGLLSIVCGSWGDSKVLVDYVPKEVWHTIYVFMCGTFEVSVQWTKASFLRPAHPGWVLTKWSDSITWKGGFVVLVSCC